jgi:hypothetical protein
MNPMLDPFLYEAVLEHQYELRESVCPSEVPNGAESPPSGRAVCFYTRRSARADRVAVMQCLSRLLSASK